MKSSSDGDPSEPRAFKVGFSRSRKSSKPKLTVNIDACAAVASTSGPSSPTPSRTTCARTGPKNVSKVLEDNARLLQQLREQQARNEELEDQLERRQQSYIRREDRYATELRKLQEDNARLTSMYSPEVQADVPSMQQLREQMVAGFEGLIEKQTKQAALNGDSLLKGFKQRLNDVEDNIRSERQQAGHEQAAFMERALKLKDELASTQDVACKLDRMYKQSQEECLRLRTQFKCQEDDREYLIRQGLLLKKENATLKTHLERVRGSLEALTVERDRLAAYVATALPPATRAEAVGDQDESRSCAVDAACKEKYNELLVSMRKTIETERARARQARAQHTAELAGRTELQVILRGCVDDVRAEQARHIARLSPANEAAPNVRPSSAVRAGSQLQTRTMRARPQSAFVHSRSSAPSVDEVSNDTAYQPALSKALRAARPASAKGSLSFGAATSVNAPSAVTMPGSDLSAEQRDAVLQRLLAKEQVLLLLYQRTFPVAAELPPGHPLISSLSEHQAAQHRHLLQQANQKPTLTPRKNLKVGALIDANMKNKPWVLNVDNMLQEFMNHDMPA